MKITDRSGTPLARDDVMSALEKDGIVHIFEASREDFMDQLSPLLKIFPHPHATGDGWTLIHPHHEPGKTADEKGFTSAALPPHTDRGLLNQPPSILFFLLLRCPSSGGDALLVDTAKVYRSVSIEELPKLQHELWLESVRYRIRQNLFTVDDGFCISRYRIDHIAAPIPFSRRTEDLLRELQKAAAHPTQIEMLPGQGYLIHNHRFLHGRTRFTGSRLGVRLLATVADTSAHQWMNRGFAIRQW
ncbi:TauD/TfdA family dioxygenase [Streptomyces daliensis]|uniref:TauD/TfdA family dioxygenase n=1 Tax=Streptomyces daliensis TaxID=299421 RepID=A0A8T4ITK1_9ACTN|nr:TauD/TfdA family dioxygenase [Streptomyces daliensis]